MVLRLEAPLGAAPSRDAHKVVRDSGLIIYKRPDLHDALRLEDPVVGPRLLLTPTMQVRQKAAPRSFADRQTFQKCRTMS